MKQFNSFYFTEHVKQHLLNDQPCRENPDSIDHFIEYGNINRIKEYINYTFINKLVKFTLKIRNLKAYKFHKESTKESENWNSTNFNFIDQSFHYFEIQQNHYFLLLNTNLSFSCNKNSLLWFIYYELNEIYIFWAYSNNFYQKMKHSSHTSFQDIIWF